MSAYVPLWVKSNGSLLEGASHPEELVERAAELGLDRLAITDRDSLLGAVRAHVVGREVGVGPLVGAEVTVGEAWAPDERWKVVLLAQGREGYGRLCRLLTHGQARMPKGQSLVNLREVGEHGEGLIALAGEPQALASLAPAFEDRLYARLARHLRADEVEAEIRLRREAARLGVPLVATTEVLYHDPARRPLADVLTCIRHRTSLDRAGRLLRPNAEHALLGAEAMAARYRDVPEALARTVEVADRCPFRLAELTYRYPQEHLPEGESEGSWLRRLTLAGARERFGGDVPGEVVAQLDRELALIEELEYGGYFLTMWDIVRFCREQEILCQGRGSAANSAVCYCLGITAIDPVRMDLLFERFLSRERAEPPDIDLDIEHQRREEVIQYVYRRWGRRRAAMVANVIRYRAKSALRDVGKALGLPQTALDQASKLLSYWSGGIDDEVLAHAGLDASAPRVRLLIELAREIRHFPRHLSIHPGGFLLGAEPVDTLVPVEPATMEGRTVIQWDKEDVENLGLFKVDLLGLGMLSQIHRAFDLLRAHEGLDLTIATVPAEDPATYRMVSDADTIGVFQIESRAQMSMLPRLRPRTFYDLVIEVAIVRPGPIQGDMVHPYLRRRNGEEPVVYPHPSLERVLQRTLGVPIFQEQVMKLAVLAAGYSAGEADQLRRDMAAWRSTGRMEAHRERIITRMIAHGIEEEFAERVFNQIRGFGEYGFPESHAASFALLSYVTSWLKCHHHAAFTCALLNAWPMGFYQPSTLVEDAKRHDVEVRPIDIRRSAWDCTLEDASPTTDGAPRRHRWAVRMGLRYVKGLGERERERLEGLGPGVDGLAELVARSGLSQRALLALASAGAFGSFGLDRRQALWEIRGLCTQRGRPLVRSEDTAPSARPSFPALDDHDEVSWDYRASLHSTRGHPMGRLRDALDARRLPDAQTIWSLPHGRRTTYVGMVICRQRPMTATGVTFLTLEDETGYVNVIVWRPVFERFETIVKTAAVLEVRGQIQTDQGVTNLIAERLAEPRGHVPRPRAATDVPRSRNFH
ncbi:MAG: error-prone DNA polymerase [Sandaracinaceae bacterium]